jgi:hypothetical protein
MNKISLVFPFGLFFIYATLRCGEITEGLRKNDHLLVDRTFLTQSLWDDGKAEIAFYNVQMEKNSLVGEPLYSYDFLAATVLVKHDYDPIKLMKLELKAGSADHTKIVSSFKWGIFYGESLLGGSPIRVFSLHAVQSDLRPLKQTYVQSSFEGNAYFELSFFPDNKIRRINRGDVYWRPDTTFQSHPNTYPLPEILLLIRGLDFSNQDRHDFGVISFLGNFTEAFAEKIGVDTLETEEGKITTEKIIVHYTKPIMSELALGFTPVEEIYWRSITSNRQILKLESEKFENNIRLFYRMTLVEELRSQHWDEDFRPRLKHLSDNLFRPYLK